MTKTGSTAIQEFLEANTEQLDKDGFIYVIPRKHAWAGPPYDEQYERKCATFEETWGPVRDALVNSSNDVIWIEEDLIHIFLEDIDRLKQVQEFVSRPVEIVMYLRRQDQHAESIYKELVKQHKIPTPFCSSSIQKIYGEVFYDYPALINVLTSCVDKNSIKVRVYDRDRFVGGDVVKDFCSAVEIPFSDQYVIPERHSNPSVDARLVEYMEVSNATWPVHNEAGHMFNELLELGFSSISHDREYRLFSLEEREEYLRQFDEINDNMAKILGLEKGKLFSPISDREMKPLKKINDEERVAMTFMIHHMWSGRSRGYSSLGL